MRAQCCSSTAAACAPASCRSRRWARSGLCIGLWIRAKTVDQDERGNAERRALFVGLWPPTIWLIGDSLARHESTATSASRAALTGEPGASTPEVCRRRPSPARRPIHGARVHRVGSGPPLVLLHPLGADRHVWDPVVERLRDRRELIGVDMPGFGDSPRAGDLRPHPGPAGRGGRRGAADARASSVRTWPATRSAAGSRSSSGSPGAARDGHGDRPRRPVAGAAGAQAE